jgi:DNA-binding response OmpR family regulator
VEGSEDDEILTRRSIRDSGIECEVVVHRAPDHAMSDLLGGRRPLPRLIVLDGVVGGGVGLLQELRRCSETRYTPIVMLSGSRHPEWPGECYRNGANGCVEKPTDSAEYRDRVALMVRYWMGLNVSPPED